MDNFFSALLSVGHALRTTLLGLALQDATWGFLAGFLATTGIFAVILSENPRHIPILLSSSAQDSFLRLAARDADGQFCISYTSFQREYNRVRIAFYLAVFALLVIAIIAMVRFRPA